MYKVSVIVPVFKVEKYIHRCAQSLFEQTLPEIEIIFVDDCSPDNSLSVVQDLLSQYPHRVASVTFLTHEVNQGLPAARNTGLAAATGEYIFHCDSDDFLEKNALELFYQKAKENEADIVWSDWYLTYTSKERYMKEPYYPSHIDALRSILGGGMKFNVWNKLIARHLYTDNGITFPQGHNMGEDMTIILLFAVASKVAYLPHALYHYLRTNENAYTNQRSVKQLEDIKYNAQRVINFLRSKPIEGINEEHLATFQLNVKYPFLASGIKEDYLLWRAWFPEANRYIFKNKTMGLRARVVQWLAAQRCWFLVRLHAYLLDKYYRRYQSQ